MPARSKAATATFFLVYSPSVSEPSALIGISTAWPDIRRPVYVSPSFKYRNGTAQVICKDIGTGISTQPNLHEVMQDIAPDARVVYVDNDPVVLSHARALLASTPEGETAYLHADLRDPGLVLREAEKTLDFTRPTAVTLVLRWSPSIVARHHVFVAGCMGD